MEVKRVKFRTFSQLRKEALRLEQLGFICEVKGWADMRTNTLTVSKEEKEGQQDDREGTI